MNDACVREPLLYKRMCEAQWKGGGDPGGLPRGGRGELRLEGLLAR